MAEVHLSRRALLDLEEIWQYSVTTWGEMVASDYLQNIEDALNRLRQNPGLITAKPEVEDSLLFYRVNLHFLVCSTLGDAIYVLTVKHGASDLPSRIGELEPCLLKEADMLKHALRKKSGEGVE
jgi:toxin ParE1/3/4